MTLAIQVCGYVFGIPLQLLAIGAILRGHYRRYPLVFLYVIADFLTTVVEIPSNIAYYAGNPHALDSYVSYYWLDESIMQAFVYAIVLSLIYQATAALPSRRMLRIVLSGGAILFTGASFLIHHGAHARVGIWMTLWARDLDFCAAVLDLVLWALLLSSKGRDYRLLMLSGALGIQFAGDAIGAALRSIGSLAASPTPGTSNHAFLDAGSAATVLSYLAY